jgi:hypothetical protein
MARKRYKPEEIVAKASIQNLHRKGTKGPLHYQEIDEKRHPSSRLGPGAMSSIALQLSRCWTTSLVVPNSWQILLLC